MSPTIDQSNDRETPNVSVTDGASWPATGEAFASLMEAHQPTVFRGLCSSWLPCDSGSYEDVTTWLDRIAGNRAVRYSVGLPGDAGTVGGAGSRGAKTLQNMPGGVRALRDITSEMRRELARPTGHVVYVQSLDVATELPEIEPFLSLATEACTGNNAHWRVWFGTGSHHVAMHIDSYENFFCLLAGRKRFHLCPFDRLHDMYVGPFEGGPYGTPASVVDPVNPDISRYPRYKRVLDESITVDLLPGDVMYLPSHWWHSVESFGFNLATNLWFNQVSDRDTHACESAFFRLMMALRQMPPHWVEYWREMCDVFAFRSYGDPYEHLPLDDQGLFGGPTVERTHAIAKRLQTDHLRAQLEGVTYSDIADTPLRLSPTAVMQRGTDSPLIIRDGQNRPRALSSEAVGLLASFAAGRIARNAVEHVGHTQGPDSEARIREAIQTFVREGLLLIDTPDNRPS